MSIEIIEKHAMNYEFSLFTFLKDVDTVVFIDFPLPKCQNCKKYSISRVYAEIMMDLKKAGLLPKDYKLICCSCYAKNMKKENCIN